MDCSREGRRISKVAIFDIFQFGFHRNRHDTDVDHRINTCAAADALNTQHHMRVPVSDHLGDQEGSTGIVGRLVICNRNSSDNIIACLTCSCLAQAGAATVEAGKSDNTGAQNAGIMLVCTCDNLCKCPAFQVGGRTHRRPLTGTGQTVMHNCAVARRVNIRQTGFHPVIDQQRAIFRHLDASITQERSVRTDTCRCDDNVCGQHTSVSLDSINLIAAEDVLCTNAAQDTNAGFNQMTADIICHFRVKYVRKQLGSNINNRYRQSLMLKVFRCFQTDKAAADHDCFLCTGCFNIAADCNGIFRGTHLENAFFVHAGYGRQCSRCTGGNDQAIILHLASAAVTVFDRNLFALCIQSDGFASSNYIDASQRCKFCGCIDDQLFLCFNHTADIIRQATSCIRNIIRICNQGNVSRLISTFQLRSSFGSSCNTANNENLHFTPSFPFNHVPFSTFCDSKIFHQHIPAVLFHRQQHLRLQI